MALKIRVQPEDGLPRCDWALTHEAHLPYHDTEWGVPVTDDRRQFEFLVLESAQAGLSWLTILKRRDGYRNAFCDFNPEAVARLTEQDVERLMCDTGIIRNRKKIEATIKNARAFLHVAEQHGSFCRYIWNFVDGRPIRNAFTRSEQIPPLTPLAERMAKEMKKLGFSFLGPTVLYAHMQATGLVNDHLTGCHCYEKICAMGDSM